MEVHWWVGSDSQPGWGPQGRNLLCQPTHYWKFVMPIPHCFKFVKSLAVSPYPHPCQIPLSVSLPVMKTSWLSSCQEGIITF